MIELHLLEQLDAFARLGTLSAASEELHISQPALTRSMKKIEELLGVTLFERHKNRLYLNDTGKLAADLAAQILKESRSFEMRVRAYDRSLRTISLGCCAPVPSYELTPVLQRLFDGMAISSDVRTDEQLKKGLSADAYQLIVLHEKPEDDSLYSVVCGHERLGIAVPPAHPLAAFDEVSFADLEDVPILQYSKVGFWAELVKQKIPHPHLLLQENYSTFGEIAKATALPTFHSDYFDRDEDWSASSRKSIMFTDPEASVTYYLICKKSEKKRFRKLFDNLPDWCLK